MAAAEKLAVVFPHDFDGTTIQKNGQGKWSVVVQGATVVSTDAVNLLTAGADGGAEITAAVIQAHQSLPSITVDNTAKTVTFNNGQGVTTTFALGTQDIHTTGMSLVGTVLHLQNSDGSADETIDLAQFLTAVTKANGNGASVTGNGTSASPLTVSVVVDPSADNLATVSVNGVKVSKNDILALLVANIALASNGNTMTVTVNGQAKTAPIVNSVAFTIDAANGVAHSNVNGVDTTVAIVEVTDTAGAHQFYAFA